MKNKKINILDLELDLIIKTIKKFNSKVVLIFFGSRLTFKNEVYSDLDLALKNISFKEFIDIKIKLETLENQIPFKIDLSHFESLDDDFAKNIFKHPYLEV